jgi:DNA-binding winged helix-turn-helix (wHTH) protein
MIIKDRLMNGNGTFIINDKVIFTPDSNSLCPVAGNASPVVLHTPSSQCLLILLLHNNEVVSQKFLFEEIWEKNGVLVTANTLYQNIALIRKALKTAGMEEEVIKTIPKQGVKISAKVMFTPFETANERLPEESDDNTSVPEPLTSANKNLQIFQVESEITNGRSANSPSSGLSRLFYNKFLGLILPTALCLLFLSYLYFLQNKDLDGKDFIDDYMDIGKIGNCQVYSSYHATEISKVKFATMAKLSGLTCQPGDIVWLTFNRLYGMSTIQKCDKPITDSKAVCANYLYQEGADNEN